MKPVEDVFSAESFRRVVLPGLIVALGVHPSISASANFLHYLYGIGSTTLLVVEIIVFGLALSSAIQFVYYVYEGIVLEPLTSFARRRNQLRVERLTRVTGELRKKNNLAPAEQRRLDIAFEKLTEYPQRVCDDGSVEYYADSATRLGNIIATYELYAQTRYGVDGVFFWFHLLNLAPENLRKDFGEQYAFSESLVLASFSGALVTLFHAILLLRFLIGLAYPHVLKIVPFGYKISAVFIVYGMLVWGLFYWAALPAHREAGKILQSIIDNAMPEFANWLRNFSAPLHGGSILKLEKVRRFLAEPSTKNAPSSSD